MNGIAVRSKWGDIPGMAKFLFLTFATISAFGLLLARGDDFPSLKEPLKTVTQKYLFIQQKLAADDFNGVTGAATEIKTAIANPPANMFSPDFAKSIDALAAAQDIHGARTAFQGVSDAYIGTLAQNQVETGSLHSAFCPMVKAYWVQADGSTIHNPYFGSAMSTCGTIQRQF